ncbi:MAG: hypothetical protein NUK54_00565 [Methanothrix sp.]|nr:hypothetical protein [Methanothrix sp.]
MPKLKIRGGDLDLVEYEFSPFSPGEKINALGIDVIRPLAPREVMVTERYPKLSKGASV